MGKGIVFVVVGTYVAGVMASLVVYFIDHQGAGSTIGLPFSVALMDALALPALLTRKLGL